MSSSTTKQKAEKKPSTKVKDSLLFIGLVVLMPFAPIILFLMWRYVKWTKRTKWIVSGIVSSLFIIGLVGYFNAPPEFDISNLQDNQITTDVAEYGIAGSISSLKSIDRFTINDQTVPIKSANMFLYTVALKEGDNKFTLNASNGNGETEQSITIHRLTRAELLARAEAEKEKFEQQNKKRQEKRAAEDAKQKAKSEKEAAEDRKNADKEAERKLALAEQKTAKEQKDTSKAENKASSCNLWCRLTGGDKDTSSEDATDTVKKNSKATPPKQAGLGDVVASGNFSFRVNSVKCGEKTISWNYGDLIRYYAKAQGRFCKLNITVKNIGDTEDSISVGSQYLYNKEGQRWSYDSSATSLAAHYLYGNPLNDDVNPGNSITGNIVYDVPKDQMPVSAEVVNGFWSSPKKILLK